MVLEHFGLRTAPFAIIPPQTQIDVTAQTKDDTIQRAIEDSHHAVRLTQYPLFARPIGECTSKGIFQCNKITKPEDLALTVDKLRVLYGNQGILLEPFLSGREITVGILGAGEDARVIGANEYVYKTSPRRPPEVDEEHDDLIDFAADTVKNAPMDTNPHLKVICANLAEPQVHSACQLALAAWKALGCRDAGRVDTRFDRMGEAGLPYILEINPIPGMFPGWSDMAIIAISNGLPYGQLLDIIINSALKRSASRRPGPPHDKDGENGDGRVNQPKPGANLSERWHKYNLRV